jgi:hypothetical protein
MDALLYPKTFITSFVFFRISSFENQSNFKLYKIWKSNKGITQCGILGYNTVIQSGRWISQAWVLWFSQIWSSPCQATTLYSNSENNIRDFPILPGPLHCRDFTITLRLTTLGRSPLDEWSTRRRDLCWQHTTLTRDRYPCPRRDSNTQSQQASGRRPTP